MPDLAELASSAISCIGPVREDNQDAVRLPDPLQPSEKGYLFGLADGMGGYANGAQASQLALDTLFSAFYASGAAPGAAFLKQGVESANLEVFKAAQRFGAGRMGTTLTAAFFSGRFLYLAHVGDSRAYRVRDGTVACLTKDHTNVAELVRMGVVSPGRVRSHPQRSVLSRAVGLEMFVTPDLNRFTLQEGDRLILCSDGAWVVIEDEEFGLLSSGASSPEKLSQALVDLALKRESDDNISVIVVDVMRLPQPLHASDVAEGSWAAGLRRLIPARLSTFFSKGRQDGGPAES